MDGKEVGSAELYLMHLTSVGGNFKGIRVSMTHWTRNESCFLTTDLHVGHEFATQKLDETK